MVTFIFIGICLVAIVLVQNVRPAAAVPRSGGVVTNGGKLWFYKSWTPLG